MAEVSDLGSTYEATMNLSEMSKEFLIKLLGEWQLQYQAFNDGLFAALLKRVSIDQFKDIIVEASTRMYEKTMPRLNNLAGIEPKTFLDYNRVGQLSLDANKSQGFFESHEEIISPNHVISTVTRCPFVLRVEQSGRTDLITTLCHDIELATMAPFYQNNPKLRIIPLKLPPREGPTDIFCKFEFKLEE